MLREALVEKEKEMATLRAELAATQSAQTKEMNSQKIKAKFATAALRSQLKTKSDSTLQMLAERDQEADLLRSQLSSTQRSKADLEIQRTKEMTDLQHQLEVNERLQQEARAEILKLSDATSAKLQEEKNKFKQQQEEEKKKATNAATIAKQNYDKKLEDLNNANAETKARLTTEFAAAKKDLDDQARETAEKLAIEADKALEETQKKMDELRLEARKAESNKKQLLSNLVKSTKEEYEKKLNEEKVQADKNLSAAQDAMHKFELQLLAKAAQLENAEDTSKRAEEREDEVKAQIEELKKGNKDNATIERLEDELKNETEAKEKAQKQLEDMQEKSHSLEDMKREILSAVNASADNVNKLREESNQSFEAVQKNQEKQFDLIKLGMEQMENFFDEKQDCPRLFIIENVDVENGEKATFGSTFSMTESKRKLTLLCEHDYSKVVSYEIKELKEFVQKAGPALKVGVKILKAGLTLGKIATKVTAGVTLPIDDGFLESLDKALETAVDMSSDLSTKMRVINEMANGANFEGEKQKQHLTSSEYDYLMEFLNASDKKPHFTKKLVKVRDKVNKKRRWVKKESEHYYEKVVEEVAVEEKEEKEEEGTAVKQKSKSNARRPPSIMDRASSLLSVSSSVSFKEARLSGYLEKRGGGKSLFGSSAYKRRFMVLKGLKIAYYKDEDASDSARGNAGTMLGSIPLDGGAVAEVVEEGKGDGREFVISYTDDETSRKFYLRADSRDGAGGAKNWVEVINEVAEMMLL